jgi:hypothetical protein
MNFRIFSLIAFVAIISSCTPSGNIDATFDGVKKISVERVKLDASRELVVEITDETEMQKIINFVNLEENGNSGCIHQLLITFHKERDKIEGFVNATNDCRAMSYTYNSNFYTKSISEEGAEYFRLLSGI